MDITIEEGRAASKSLHLKFGYFLSISQQGVSADIIQNLEGACLYLIVRKHVYNCSRIFTAADHILYCIVHVGVRTCTLYRVYIDTR
jgi:hypothetical protein